MASLICQLMLQLLLFTISSVASPYSEYILTPRSRTILPASVHSVNGTVVNAKGLIKASGTATFTGKSAVTYDFGKNVAGIVSFDVVGSQGQNEFIGISFTESSLWIRSDRCDAMADAGIDAPLWFPVTRKGSYKASKEHQRGGFRYMTVYHNTTGSVKLESLSIYFTAVPQVKESSLGQYAGYFHCDDEQLNRVWYAGAYTTELCTIDPTAGDSLIYLGEISSNDTVTRLLPWYLNYTITDGSSALVDGAKRDRLVWPGDMAIAVPSMFVSTNDMTSVKNSLDSLLRLQNRSTGALPYAGVPFQSKLPVFSYTYHLYSLIGINDYYLYTGNKTYLSENWHTFKFGLNYSLSFIDSSGLANITSAADWLRVGMGAHNIEANAILYYVTNLGISLAENLNDTTVTAQWSKYASGIKSAANARLWDAKANLYRDNDTHPLTNLHPQDGNSWAVVSNLTTSMAQKTNISSALAARWGPYGAPAPEAGSTISPFISGFELQAHYIAGQASSAVKLMKRMWADFMLDDPRMTNSTFIEGYSTNGSLHYAPYTNDPRVSHAHGWATGPTSALTFYTAGIQVTSAAGKTWKIAPNLGGLKNVQAGYKTSLGRYTVNVTGSSDGGMAMSFETPAGTTGVVGFEIPENKAATITIVNMQGGGSGNTTLDISTGGGSSAQTRELTIDQVSGGKYQASLILH